MLRDAGSVAERIAPGECLSRRKAGSTGEQSAFVNEAKLVAKWVNAIKTAFPPGLSCNRPQDGTVRLLADAGLVCLKIDDGEVQVVRIGCGVPGVAVGPRIEARQDGSAAIKVMASGRDAHPWLFENGRVVRGGGVDAGDRNDYAKQTGRRHARSVSRFRIV